MQRRIVVHGFFQRISEWRVLDQGAKFFRRAGHFQKPGAAGRIALCALSVSRAVNQGAVARRDAHVLAGSRLSQIEVNFSVQTYDQQASAAVALKYSLQAGY